MPQRLSSDRGTHERNHRQEVLGRLNAGGEESIEVGETHDIEGEHGRVTGLHDAVQANLRLDSALPGPVEDAVRVSHPRW